MQEPLVLAPEKAVATLPIMETFYSVQGEGFHSGTPAFFIRLGGCDVGCTWCDVKESWDQSKHPQRAVNALHEQTIKSGAPIAVITGGEPAMYDLNELTLGLAEGGIQTHLETSGAYPLSGQWHWICFSPKKFKKPLPEIYQQAHELKVVVYNKHDLQWALEHAQLVTPDCKLFLQPEWSRKETVMPLIADFVRIHTDCRISLQTHKYMNLP